jgi:hypothetical protein
MPVTIAVPHVPGSLDGDLGHGYLQTSPIVSRRSTPLA